MPLERAPPEAAEPLCGLCALDSGPRVVDIGVDSGAGVTVWPEGWDTDYPLEATAASLSNTCYYPAGRGSSIKDLGNRSLRCKVAGREMGIRAHICEVRKPLLSVSESVDAGHRVVFDKPVSYIEHKATGVKTPLKRQNGVFTLALDVQPFRAEHAQR